MDIEHTPADASDGAPEDEIVQYYVVNRDLPMSPGKIAAQVAHAATVLAMRGTIADQAGTTDGARFRAWVDGEMKKIVLQGTTRDLERLLATHAAAGLVPIRDNGYTEIPAGSLTVVGLPPMLRSAAKPIVKRLRLFGA